jgi:ANTAR domain
LSFQLFVHSENLGALNLYGDQPGAFSEESVFVGGVLAQHAAVAMMGAANITHLRDALATRDIIGQAKGMLMQRQKLTGIQAFNLLVRASQESNIKLVDVARWLVAEHESRLGHHPSRHNYEVVAHSLNSWRSSSSASATSTDGSGPPRS